MIAISTAAIGALIPPWSIYSAAALWIASKLRGIAEAWQAVCEKGGIRLGSADDLIAQIYAGVFEHPMASFKEATLASINLLIPFDSGIWASGVHATNTIFSVAVHNYPLEQLVTYSFNWQEQDFVRAAAVAQPGRTLRNEDVMPLADYYQTRIYREYSAPAGIEHSLGTALADPVTTLGELIYLFRKDLGQPFTDEQRDLKQRVAPHLAAAWQQKQVLQTYAGGTKEIAPAKNVPAGHAIVDPSGHLHATDARFSEAMAGCFPGWSGPVLPDQLLPLLSPDHANVKVGGLRYTVRKGVDRHLIQIDPLTAISNLSAREHGVAKLFAEGRTQSAIAADTGVSVSTVRNQIASVYRKLNVHTKVDLARALGEL